MGLFDWLRRGRSEDEAAPAPTPAAAPAAETPDQQDEWELVPAYLPVDASEHRVAVVAATAIAAGDSPESQLTVRRVSIANDEHRRVACIATAIAAGALESSKFVVKNIYKNVKMEDGNAA